MEGLNCGVKKLLSKCQLQPDYQKLQKSLWIREFKKFELDSWRKWSLVCVLSIFICNHKSNLITQFKSQDWGSQKRAMIEDKTNGAVITVNISNLKLENTWMQDVLS